MYDPNLSVKQQWEESFKQDPSGAGAIKLLEALDAYMSKYTTTLEPCRMLAYINGPQEGWIARVAEKMKGNFSREANPIFGLFSYSADKFRKNPPAQAIEIENLLTPFRNLEAAIKNGDVRAIHDWGKNIFGYTTSGPNAGPTSYSRATIKQTMHAVADMAFENAPLEKQLEYKPEMQQKIYRSAILQGDVAALSKLTELGIKPNMPIDDVYPLTLNWLMGQNVEAVHDCLKKAGASEKLFMSQRTSPEFMCDHLHADSKGWNKAALQEAIQLVGKQTDVYVGLRACISHGLTETFDELLEFYKSKVDKLPSNDTQQESLTAVASRLSYSPEYLKRAIEMFNIPASTVVESCSSSLISLLRNRSEPEVTTYVDQLKTLPIFDAVLRDTGKKLGNSVNWPSILAFDKLSPGLIAEHLAATTTLSNYGMIKNAHAWMAGVKELAKTSRGSGAKNLLEQTVKLEEFLIPELTALYKHTRSFPNGTWEAITGASNYSTGQDMLGKCVNALRGVTVRQTLAEKVLSDGGIIPWECIPSSARKDLVSKFPESIQHMDPKFMCDFPEALGAALEHDAKGFVTKKHTYIPLVTKDEYEYDVSPKYWSFAEKEMTLVDYLLNPKELDASIAEPLLKAVVEKLPADTVEELILENPSMPKNRHAILVSSLSDKLVEVGV